MATGALDGPLPAAAESGRRVLGLLDEAIRVQSPRVGKNIARARQRNPEATPTQVIRNLERMYVTALAGAGAAVGAVAAAPGFGTGVALALSAGEAASALGMSTLFALSLAEVHAVPLGDLERRRTIVMGIVLGGSGSLGIPKVAERTGQHWGRQVVAKTPAATLRQINSVLGPNFVTKYGTKQGVVVLGRVAPFGFGAVIGAGGNAVLAATTVMSGRRAFGPPPTSWPSPNAQDPASGPRSAVTPAPHQANT